MRETIFISSKSSVGIAMKILSSHLLANCYCSRPLLWQDSFEKCKRHCNFKPKNMNSNLFLLILKNESGKEHMINNEKRYNIR